MSDSLPTPEQMLDAAQRKLDKAYVALSDAAEWLWSDWPPGSEMTRAQADRRSRMVKAIATAKAAINEAKR